MRARFVVCGQYARTWLFSRTLTGELIQETAKEWLGVIAPTISPCDATIYVCYGNYVPDTENTGYREARAVQNTVSRLKQRYTDQALFPKCIVDDGTVRIDDGDTANHRLAQGQDVDASIAAHIRATPAGEIVVLVSNDCGSDGYTAIRDAMMAARSNGASVHNVQFWTGGKIHRTGSWKTYAEICGPDQLWLADVVGGASARSLSQYQDLAPDVWERVGLLPSLPSPPLAPEVAPWMGTIAAVS